MPSDPSNERNLDDRDILEPEDSAADLGAARIHPQPADVRDPADDIPVPIAMSPAEIDERAQAVDAVRSNADLEPRIDT